MTLKSPTVMWIARVAPTSALARVAWIVGWGLLWGDPAWSQSAPPSTGESAPPKASQPSPAQPAAPQPGAPIAGLVYVEVNGHGPGADAVPDPAGQGAAAPEIAVQVRRAIARELGAALTSDPRSARSRVAVTIQTGSSLTVSYTGPSGTVLTRVVRTPERGNDVAEVAALLTSNLARDDASELLKTLAQRSTAESPGSSSAQATGGDIPLTPVAEPGLVAEPDAGAEPDAAPGVGASVSPKLAARDKSPGLDKRTAQEPALPYVMANASFVHPWAVFPDSHERTVGLEFGVFYSDVGGVDEFGLSGLALRVRQRSDGVLIAGLANLTGLSNAERLPRQHHGVRLAGLLNYGGGALEGASVAGLVDVQGTSNADRRTLDGAQLAGLATVSGGAVLGAQVGGLAAYANGMDGAQIGGLSSVALGHAAGAQLSGGVNVAGDLTGVQFSAVNVAGDVQGAQIGIVNIGRQIQGLQLGIVNVADDVDGASIGLVTYSKSGQTQAVAWFDSTRPLNMGARFVTGPLYAMPFVATDAKTTNEFDYGLALGARVPLQQFFVDIEAGSSQHFDGQTVDESEIDLRYRASVGFRVVPGLGVFAGGGVRQQLNAKDAPTPRYTGLWTAGLEFF